MQCITDAFFYISVEILLTSRQRSKNVVSMAVVAQNKLIQSFNHPHLFWAEGNYWKTNLSVNLPTYPSTCACPSLLQGFVLKSYMVWLPLSWRLDLCSSYRHISLPVRPRTARPMRGSSPLFGSQGCAFGPVGVRVQRQCEEQVWGERSDRSHGSSLKSLLPRTGACMCVCVYVQSVPSEVLM